MKLPFRVPITQIDGNTICPLLSVCEKSFFLFCSLAGAMIASILRGYDPHLCVKAGLHAAFLSLQTHEAVSDQIVAEKFTKERIEEWMTWSYRDIAV